MVATWKRLGEELREAGLQVTDVWQVVRMGGPYPDAIPVLMRWAKMLPDTYPPSPDRDRLLEGVVRALSVPEARPAAAGVLIDLFPKTSGPLQWIVGNAIEVTASTREADQVLDLIKDERHGSSRQMLVLALRRIAKRNPRTVGVLRQCLDDDTVVAQAMTVLASIDPRLATELVAPKQHHPDPAVAAAARKAFRAAAGKAAKRSE